MTLFDLCSNLINRNENHLQQSRNKEIKLGRTNSPKRKRKKLQEVLSKFSTNKNKTAFEKFPNQVASEIGNEEGEHLKRQFEKFMIYKEQFIKNLKIATSKRVQHALIHPWRYVRTGMQSPNDFLVNITKNLANNNSVDLATAPCF